MDILIQDYTDLLMQYREIYVNNDELFEISVKQKLEIEWIEEQLEQLYIRMCSIGLTIPKDRTTELVTRFFVSKIK